MIRMLIVDDEHHIVNWLYELFTYKDDPAFEVLKAYSGYEAIQILKDYKINLLLLDITMPGISGFDVAEKALHEWPDLYIIFLTAHDNFDYIYHSNQLPHTSYLLKTETDATILSTVQKFLLTISNEQKICDMLQTSEGKELLIECLTQQEFLHILLHGTYPLTANELHIFKLHKIPLRFSGSVFLMYTQLSDNFSYKEASKNSEKILTSLLLFVKKFLNNRFRFSLLNLHCDCYLWLFEENNTQTHTLSMSSLSFLKSLSEAMLSNVENTPNHCAINLLYHDSVTSASIRCKISQLLFTAHEIIQNSGKKDSYCTIITDHDLISLPVNGSLHNFSLSLKSNDLSAFLAKRDKSSYLLLLTEISNRYKNTLSMHDLNAIQDYNTIAISLICYLNQHDLEKTIALKIAIYPLYYIQDFSTWKDAFQYLYTFANYLFDLISNSESDRMELLLSKIEKYVSKNIANPLTLSEIASAVNYNATYISKIYKKSRGISLPKFILQSKISLAKDLLIHSDDSIQTIAYETGFDTSQYFSIVFKRETGITPRDFRQNSKL